MPWGQGPKHRQGQEHEGRAREPRGLDRGDQMSCGRTEDGEVRSRADVASLQLRSHGPGLVVELTPRDVDDGVARGEVNDAR